MDDANALRYEYGDLFWLDYYTTGPGTGIEGHAGVLRTEGGCTVVDGAFLAVLNAVGREGWFVQRPGAGVKPPPDIVDALKAARSDWKMMPAGCDKYAVHRRLA